MSKPLTKGRLKANLERFLIGTLFLVICASMTLFIVLAGKELGWLEWPDSRKTHQENTKWDRGGQSKITDNLSIVREISSDVENKRGDEKAQEKNATTKQLFQESEKDRLDIYAQEGMWRAANYLLVTTVLTAVLSGFALLFIYRTYNAQRDELIETRKANALGLKPYLQLKYREVEFFANEFPNQGKQIFNIKFQLLNIGKTPATSMFISINPSKCQISCFNASLRSNSAEFRGEDDICFKIEAYLDTREAGSVIGLYCDWLTSSKAWIDDVSGKQRGVAVSDWECVGVRIEEVVIRYKDFECEGTDWHKVAYGSIYYSRSDSEWSQQNTRITRTGKCEDKKQKAYAAHLKPLVGA